jgi:hypothetical protein
MAYVQKDLSYTSSTSPYENFIRVLESDPNPNFLRYTLFVLEKSVMSQQAEVLRAIREEMEEKYSLPSLNPWTDPPFEKKDL